jgi:hypothetical protein
MANAPGVRFEESPNQQVVVSPASATLAGFLGTAKRGPVADALLVTGWADFVEKFGGFTDSYDLGLGLWDYFKSGGGAARVLRVVGTGAVQSTATLKQGDNTGNGLVVRAANPGAWGNDLAIDIFSKSSSVGNAAAEVNSATAKAGHMLPNAASNNQSEDVLGMVLKSVRGVEVGDVYVAYDADGAVINNSQMLIVSVDATSKEVRYISTGAGNPIENGHIKSASRHLAKTSATAHLVQGGTSIELASTEGIERGSLLSLIYYADYADTALVTSSAVKKAEVVVSKVIGNVVHFTAGAAATSNANIPVAGAAKAIVTGADDGLAAGNSITITAKDLGTGGNEITVTLQTGAADITVTGASIVVTAVAETTTAAIASAINADTAAAALVTAVAAGADASDIGAAARPFRLNGGTRLAVVSQEFDVKLFESGTSVEVGRHLGLSIDSTSRNFVGLRLGGALNATTGFYEPSDSSKSRRLILALHDDMSTSVAKLPLPATGLSLTAGVDGNAPTDDQLIGLASPRTGVNLFSAYDDVDFLSAPGQTSTTFMLGATAYAEGRGDLLLLLDAPQEMQTADDLAVFRSAQLGIESTYAALYAPWGRIPDPRSTVPRGSLIEVPPGPAMAGLIVQRVERDGVHHSAANQSPPNWVGVTVNLDESDHAILNDVSVNVIRIIRRSGLRLFGSRTLSSSQDARRFTNVRRFVNYIKQSLSAQLLPLTFKPVNESLFSDITHLATRLLTDEWQKGALFPQSSSAKAFVVKCDSETTSAIDMANGVVNCVIGMSPTVPAEQIVFRLNVSTGGIQVEEA